MLATLITIAALHWAVLLTPGFNVLLIGQLAASGQRSAAFAAVAGMTTATLVWATLAVAGVGIVFAAHPSIRLLAQLAGGLYLVYLAVRMWRAGGAAAMAAGAPAAVPGRAAAFRIGLLTSLLNPKIALFYASVFATALPADPSATLTALAVALVFANSVVWHVSVALVLSQPRVQRAYLRRQGLLNRVSGVLVGAFGTRLIASAVQALRGPAA